MKAQFLHYLTSSFLQWFEHELLTKGEAYTNYGAKFYEVADPKRPHLSVYSSPFGPMVYDQSVTGAQIMNSVYVGNSVVNRGTSGLAIDYAHGRVIFQSGLRGLNVSGNFSIKEFDVVYSTKPEDELLVSSKFVPKPKIAVPLTGLDENQYMIPAVFITEHAAKDIPIQFGGQFNENVARYRALVIAQNDWQLDGVGSIFTDAQHKSFPFLTSAPLNEFGDTKSGNYNYTGVANLAPSNGLVFVDDIHFTRFSSQAAKAIDPYLRIGVIEVTLKTVRN